MPLPLVSAEGTAKLTSTHPNTPLEVRVDSRLPRYVVVSLDGEIDLQTAPCLSAALEDQLGLEPTILVADLTEVGFLGVAGLNALLDAHRASLDRGVEFRLVVGRSRVARRVIELCDPDGALPLYRELDEATGRAPGP